MWNAAYTTEGQPAEIDLATAAVAVHLDQRHLRPRDPRSPEPSGASPPPRGDDTSLTYGYDHAGNLTSASDSVTGNYQCYQYDYLARLTAAWAQGTSGRPSAPPGKSGLGGPAPYQQTLTYDTFGTSNVTTGDITSNTLITGTGSSATTTATTQTFPAAGATPAAHRNRAVHHRQRRHPHHDQPDLDRARAAHHRQDRQHHHRVLHLERRRLSPRPIVHRHHQRHHHHYRYDASGNLLVVQDGTTSTLYLPGEELTATGSRRYRHPLLHRQQPDHRRPHPHRAVLARPRPARHHHHRHRHRHPGPYPPLLHPLRRQLGTPPPVGPAPAASSAAPPTPPPA